MLPNRETLLCRYHYDPLDRLVGCTPSAQAVTRRFYLKDRLATEIQGAVQRSIMQHDDLLLAQQQRQNRAVEAHLFATDQQRSVLNVLDATRLNPLAYSPYGHRPAENGLLSLLGFNGERPDPVTGCYLLGNGYRAFNPVLMRFNSPDSWSPFGEGGLNAYAYCEGDPINHDDQTGHMLRVKSYFGIKTSTTQNTKNHAPALPEKKPSHSQMRNISKLGEGAYSFESIHKGGSRINISAHGSKKHPGKIKVGEALWGADEIINNLSLDNFDSIRVLACYSDELGATLAMKTGKPVKAYIGPVTTTHGPTVMMEVFKKTRSSHLPDMGKYNSDFRVTKVNPFDPEKQKTEHLEFNYHSVRFKP